MSEFDLIRRYFHQSAEREDVVVGNGDDCAVLEVPAGHQLAVSVDTLLEGTHFLPDADAESLGHKALAVSLSDLAAMGSVPRWATLALTLPTPDETWLESFARGFYTLAQRYGVALVGGDTTRGPLSITVQLMGTVLRDRAVTRGGASLGDDIYVTGTIGDAALGLKSALGRYRLEPHHEYACRLRLDRPEPRVSSGVGLSPFVSAMIDCSDGLIADLGHLLEASSVGAVIQVSRIPLSEAMRGYLGDLSDWSICLAGGDDYELIFTAPPESRSVIAALADSTACAISWLGTVTSHDKLIVLDEHDSPMSPVQSGYQHF